MPTSSRTWCSGAGCACPIRLSSDDDRVGILLYCHPVEDKASIYKTLFENSLTGIVIAAPVKNEVGTIVDAWVIAQNEPASQLTGVYDHATSDLLLRHGRVFARDDIWTYITEGVGQRTTVATLSDASARRHGDDLTPNSWTSISCCA